MSRIQQGSLLKLKRKSGPDVWVLRWYDETGGTRTYRKRTLGNVIRQQPRNDDGPGSGQKEGAFSTLEGCEAGNKKRVRIAPAPSSAPLKEVLDFATCHKTFVFLGFMAGTTGLEPATSAVTGQRSNQLSYVPQIRVPRWLRWRSALQR